MKHIASVDQSEPVAWRYKYEKTDTAWNFQDDADLIKSMQSANHIISEPLYTTPQTKPLNWIDVNDRFPNDGQTVAFVVKSSINDYLDGRVLGGRYTAGICGGFSVPGMTTLAYCWMPLPDAPAIEAKVRGQ